MIDIVENFKKSLVYYTFTNFLRSGQGPLAPPPLNTPMDI